MRPKVIAAVYANRFAIRFIVPFFLGILTARGNPPEELLIFSLAGYALFVLCWFNLPATAERVYFGFSYALGYFVLSLLWVGTNFIVGESQSLFLALFSVAAITIYSSLFWTAAFLAVSILPVQYFDRAWLLGLAIPVADLARATIGQTPIALFGGMWTETPMVHFASAGSAFLIALSVCLPVSLIVGKRYTSAFIVMVLFAGYLGIHGLAPVLLSNTRVAIVQHNAEQSLKWSDGYDSVLEERLFTMVRSAQSHGADIIIAPENAITRLMLDDDPFFDRLKDSDMPPLLFGAPSNNSSGQLANAAILASGDLDQPVKYDKVHLAPVAEMDIWPFSRSPLSLAPGVSQEVFDLPGNLPSVAPLICFDAAFALWKGSFSSRPDLLAVITSESLIGKYGSHQALNNSIIRAVETGLPVVRSSATGLSAIIAPDGRVLVQTGFDTRDLRIARLPLPFEATLYWKYGRLLNYIAIMVILSASMLTARFSMRSYLSARSKHA